MCGIFGAISNSCIKETLEGLKLLEYRGYDSAGLAVLNNGNITVQKSVGRVSLLQEKCKTLTCGGVAIGHTRWATHGKVTENNAHPFVSNDGRLALVHNGIIDNHTDIRQHAIDCGRIFFSDTDSEAVLHTVDINLQSSGDVLTAVSQTCKVLKGSFAIAMIDNVDSNLYLMRNQSPLYVGVDGGNSYVSSDVNTLRYFCSKVYILPNNSYGVLNKTQLKVYDILTDVPLKCQQLNVDRKYIDKEYQGDIMLKEIFEIPNALQRTFDYLKGCEFFTDTKQPKQIDKVFLVGCGTAYHSCLTGERLLRKFCKIDARAVLASELLNSYLEIDKNTLVIAVTQSGETADTLTSCRYAKSCGATVYAVTNVEGSSVTFVADKVILTQADSEVAVASTKAYACQLLALTLFALRWAVKTGRITSKQYNEYLEHFDDLVDGVHNICQRSESDIYEASKKLSDSKAVFFIGRGGDYCTAQEGSLKLKEVSYIHSEAYASGELKHGTLALMEQGVCVVGIACEEELLTKQQHAVNEVQSRGATVLSVTPFEDNLSDMVLIIPVVDSIYYPILAVVPLQLIAYHCAVLKGNDPDKPRNLAKSVTVE